MPYPQGGVLTLATSRLSLQIVLTLLDKNVFQVESAKCPCIKIITPQPVVLCKVYLGKCIVQLNLINSCHRFVFIYINATLEYSVH